MTEYAITREEKQIGSDYYDLMEQANILCQQHEVMREERGYKPPQQPVR
jgi:hypothetical protein